MVRHSAEKRIKFNICAKNSEGRRFSNHVFLAWRLYRSEKGGPFFVSDKENVVKSDFHINPHVFPTPR